MDWKLQFDFFCYTIKQVPLQKNSTNLAYSLSPIAKTWSECERRSATHVTMKPISSVPYHFISVRCSSATTVAQLQCISFRCCWSRAIFIAFHTFYVFFHHYLYQVWISRKNYCKNGRLPKRFHRKKIKSKISSSQRKRKFTNKTNKKLAELLTESRCICNCKFFRQFESFDATATIEPRVGFDSGKPHFHLFFTFSSSVFGWRFTDRFNFTTLTQHGTTLFHSNSLCFVKGDSKYIAQPVVSLLPKMWIFHKRI